MGSRLYIDKKATVEQATELSIFKLNEWGLLKGNCHTQLSWTRQKSSIGVTIDITGRPFARLNYTAISTDGSPADIDYRIFIAKTPCYFGGTRYWFLCPKCGRQAAKLYLIKDGRQFTCRICSDLAYESTTKPRCMRPGSVGYWLTAHRKTKEINAKRHTWGGMPTRKIRRIERLKEKAFVKPEDILNFLNN